MDIKFGWIKDKKDDRDLVYRVSNRVDLPTSFSLRDLCPPVLDQGSLGSCVANSLGNNHLFCQRQQPGGIDSLPSRLWIYLQARKVENTVNLDNGCSIRDAIKCLASVGAPPETEWPYIINNMAEDVTDKLSKDALCHKVTKYESVEQSLYSIKAALYTEKRPISLGIILHDSFMSNSVAVSGIVNMPQQNDNSIGGHAVLLVGYDDNVNRFQLMNSWGDSWGDKGFFTLPYQYLLDENLANDFWLISVVEE